MARLVVVIFLFAIVCTQKTLSVPVDSNGSLVVTSSERNEPTTKEGSNSPPLPNIKIYQMHVTSEVANRFSRTTILSKVKNSASKAQEATFSIVLPDTAYISGFIMEISGKNYTAYVKEKEEAKRTYDEAIMSGQGAAHVAVSARDSNRFTVSVNIEPEAKAAFYLSYEELLRRQDGHYELVINLHPGQPVNDLSVEVKIAESRKLVDLKAPPLRSGNEIGEENADLDPRADIKKLDDKTAIVTFSPNLERQKVLAGKLGGSDDSLSGQFVVQYDVERDPQGGEVLVKDGYFVHFFAPSGLKALPKHVVFVLDTSSSMYGQKIVQLREAMVKILDQLNEHDKFNLVEFNSNVKVWDLADTEKSVWFPASSDDYSWTSPSNADEVDLANVTFPAAYEANPENVKRAKEAVTSLTPNAATDIHTSLKVGLHLVELAKSAKTAGKHQPMIVFLTDGDPTVRVTSTETIVSQITEFNSGPRKSAIFTLSFGNDADKTFLTKIAGRNFGFSRHIYEAADAALQLEHFYRQISSPLLANVTFKYESSATSLTTTDFPMHFGGSEIAVAGFCGTSDLLVPIVDGWGDDGLITFKPKVEHAVSTTERLWAYLTVKQLLEKKEASDKEEEELKKKALELALKYQFVTAVSSLVVVKPNATDNLVPEAADKGGDAGGSAAGGVAHRFSFAPASGGFAYEQSASIPLSLDADFSALDSYDSFYPSTTYRTTVVTSESPKPDIFGMIPWLKESLQDGGDTIELGKGKFKLGLNETISDVVPCPKTPLDEAAGHCKLLDECRQVHKLLLTKDVFESHFCVLRNEYAGVCCPDLP